MVTRREQEPGDITSADGQILCRIRDESPLLILRPHYVFSQLRHHFSFREADSITDDSREIQHFVGRSHELLVCGASRFINGGHIRAPSLLAMA